MNEDEIVFSKQWHKAVNGFTVLQHRLSGLPDGMTMYIHAEADTGSRYEFLGQEVQIDYRNPHSPTLMGIVLNPWVNAWPLSGGMIHPDYALEHWGRDGAWMASHYHGGDAAVLCIGLNMLVGANVEDARDFASTFFIKEDEDGEA